MFDDNRDCLWIGCSDNPGAGAISPSPKMIFHDNIANLVAASDINCLSATQIAVEVYGVSSIVVCGHHGCRGVTTAIEDRRFDFLSNWLRPVVRLADKYKFLVERIVEAPDRLDALCELNVIEQVAAACSTTIVQETWASGQTLSVHGLIYDRRTVLRPDFHLCISGNDELSTEHAVAIAAFVRRWGL